jgi:hypothetical protein
MARIEETRHTRQPSRTGHDYCRGCNETWPCESIIRSVVEQHEALALNSEKDRERLISALWGALS